MPNSRQDANLRRFSLQEYIGVIFTALILVTGLTVAFTGYRMVVRTTIAATDQWAKTVAGGVKQTTAS